MTTDTKVTMYKSIIDKIESLMNEYDTIIDSFIDKSIIKSLHVEFDKLPEIYQIIGNTGGAISPSSWKNLMTLLESKGYVWKNGELPTQSAKCPSELVRYLFINKDKTMTFGEVSNNKLVIKLNDFKKFLKS